MSVQIRIERVGKTYFGAKGDHVALNAVSLDVERGEFFTLLGPSGCGKTTLLRILAGFETATSGRVLVDGVDVSALPPEARSINTVFQHYALFPHMTIAENVAFGLKRLRRPAADVASRTREMLELVQMTALAERRPTQLSGGQQQRVALARALAPRPDVILLDEPLSALDLKLRQAMRFELKRLQKETGVTFIFVTHDQDEALSMSDRIAVLAHGDVQQLGTPEDIYSRPANRFVAQFIGDANLLKGKVIGVDAAGQARCRINEELIVLASCDGALVVGQEALVSARPEQIRLLAPSDEGAAGEVRNVAFMGDFSLVELAVGEGVIRVQTSGETLRELGLAPGSAVRFQIPPLAARIVAGQ